MHRTFAGHRIDGLCPLATRLSLFEPAGLRAQGDRHDETALRLALLATVVDLGWNKALDAADHPDEAIRAHEAAELSWWIGQARRTLDLALL